MNKVALVTGAAKRVGAIIATELHENNVNVALHYHYSKDEAVTLAETFNAKRSGSAMTLQGDIADVVVCQTLIDTIYKKWRRLDYIVNNASSFFPTPLEKVTEREWSNLFGSNLKGPFFICQAAAPHLKASGGAIVNIIDIHAERPLKNYPVYSMAKAGLAMLTKSLARELAPEVRVNAVSPGPILWPENQPLSEDTMERIINSTCLKRMGTPQDVADSVWFLLNQNYITGQNIAVDGGRSIKDA